IELTRRREFIQASPDESSCETRSRRSRPTIYWRRCSRRLIRNERGRKPYFKLTMFSDENQSNTKRNFHSDKSKVRRITPDGGRTGPRISLVVKLSCERCKILFEHCRFFGWTLR